MTAGYEDRAADWIRLARREGHDAYWRYREAFFELVPSAPARLLEVGCGEGRVARDLADRGHTVTGLDISPSLVAAAAEADSRPSFVVGDAAALPFPDAAFDIVVSYNSLIDVADMRTAVAEAGRVLRPGGHFCVCVPHPLSDAGEFVGTHDDARFVVEGSYLAESDYEFLSDRDGIRFRFASRRYPLEAYSRALEDAGLALEALREPPLPGPDGDRRTRIPLFLLWRAVKRGACA